MTVTAPDSHVRQDHVKAVHMSLDFNWAAGSYRYFRFEWRTRGPDVLPRQLDLYSMTNIMDFHQLQARHLQSSIQGRDATFTPGRFSPCRRPARRTPLQLCWPLWRTKW